MIDSQKRLHYFWEDIKAYVMQHTIISKSSFQQIPKLERLHKGKVLFLTSHSR